MCMFGLPVAKVRLSLKIRLARTKRNSILIFGFKRTFAVSQWKTKNALVLSQLEIARKEIHIANINPSQ